MNIGGVNRNTNAHIPGPIMSQHRAACCDSADPHGVRVGKSAQEPRVRATRRITGWMESCGLGAGRGLSSYAVLRDALQCGYEEA